MRKPVGIIGFSRSGKTMLVTALIRHFSARGERVAYVKHTHHLAAGLDEGGDSRRALDAGASIVVIADDRETMQWLPDGTKRGPEAYDDPASLVASLDSDRVFVEGWKTLRPWPVILVERKGCEMLRPAAEIAAVVSDFDSGLPVPRFETDELVAIAEFVDRIAGS